jgi:hypothetical protein
VRSRGGRCVRSTGRALRSRGRCGQGAAAVNGRCGQGAAAIRERADRHVTSRRYRAATARARDPDRPPLLDHAVAHSAYGVVHVQRPTAVVRDDLRACPDRTLARGQLDHAVLLVERHEPPAGAPADDPQSSAVAARSELSVFVPASITARVGAGRLTTVARTASAQSSSVPQPTPAWSRSENTYAPGAILGDPVQLVEMKR